MALNHFLNEMCDVCVIETGLGGRLDSTNIINPILSIITNVSLDHTDILGNTLESIAFEKAGIIKDNTPVVIGEYNKNTYPTFKKIASDKIATLFVQNPPAISINMKARFKKNAIPRFFISP